MSLTLRDVRPSDLAAFTRWRADPRLAEMLRRPSQPVRLDRGWYQSVVEGETLRGYVAIDAGEVSVLTDPDNPCDAEALQLAIEEARRNGVTRLFAETNTPARHAVVIQAGFGEVRHWTLRIAHPATPPASPATGVGSPA